jgi:hypothetical protein
MTIKEAAEVFPLGKAGSLLRTGYLGKWTFCYEDGALESIKVDVLRRLSADTETIQMFKGGDGMNIVKYFRDGRTIESFEPTERATLRGDDARSFSPRVLGQFPRPVW